VFVVEAKVRRGIVPFSPIGDRKVRKLRFVWTIHIYSLLTQPGRSTVAPAGYTSEPIEAAEYVHKVSFLQTSSLDFNEI
jgi:hypothetical protein